MNKLFVIYLLTNASFAFVVDANVITEYCDIPTIPNGKFLHDFQEAMPGDQIPGGGVATLVCDPGFRLIIDGYPEGNNIPLGCKPNGQWEIPASRMQCRAVLTAATTRRAAALATTTTRPVDLLGFTQEEYAECGGLPVGRIAKPANGIVGGEIASIQDFPWMVKILIATENSLLPGLCGGSVISPDWILTAAHCFDTDERKLINITMYFGRANFSSASYESSAPPEDTRYATSAIIHPNYSFQTTTFYYDFALIRLNPPLQLRQNIRPICLPDELQFCDEVLNPQSPRVDSCIQVSAAGWGITDVDFQSAGSLEITSKQLKSITLSIYSREACEQQSVKFNGYRRNVTNVQICAGRREPNQDTCAGDSGGPLICRSPKVQGRAVVIGLISYGDGCGQVADLPAIYSRVCQAMPWIREQTNISSGFNTLNFPKTTTPTTTAASPRRVMTTRGVTKPRPSSTTLSPTRLAKITSFSDKTSAECRAFSSLSRSDKLIALWPLSNETLLQDFSQNQLNLTFLGNSSSYADGPFALFSSLRGASLATTLPRTTSNSFTLVFHVKSSRQNGTGNDKSTLFKISNNETNILTISWVKPAVLEIRQSKNDSLVHQFSSVFSLGYWNLLAIIYDSTEETLTTFGLLEPSGSTSLRRLAYKEDVKLQGWPANSLLTIGGTEDDDDARYNGGSSVSSSSNSNDNAFACVGIYDTVLRPVDVTSSLRVLCKCGPQK